MVLSGGNTVGTRGTLSALTSLRFFAALFVVVHHVSSVSGDLGLIYIIRQVGWLGVSFFFILSGFVLMWSFDPQMSAGKYIARRLVRIYPLHFLCLTTSLIFFLFTNKVLDGYVGTVPGTFMNFLLVQDWIVGHPEIRQAWNGVSWTLSCEFFFYILAPIVFPLFVKIQSFEYLGCIAVVWLALAGVISIAQFFHWHGLLDFYLYHPLPRSFEFFLGAIGAQWIKSGCRFPSVITSMVVMIVPAMLYETVVRDVTSCPDLLNVLFIPGAFLLIISTAGRDCDGMKSWLHRPVLVRLGDASFALYMIHAMLLSVFAAYIAAFFSRSYHSSPALEWLLTLLFILAAVLASLLVHDLFELPVRLRLMRDLKLNAAGPKSIGVLAATGQSEAAAIGDSAL
jgi:peptidoglycan/LPS O-acetylase OafA/YrhL